MANLDVTTSGAHLAQGLVTPTGGGADKTLADMAAASHAAVTVAGTPDYVTLSDQQLTLNAVDLTADVTGALPIANGGTGATSATDAFTAIKQAATDTATGVVELATNAEVATGTDTTRAVTPAGAASRYQPLDATLTSVAALDATEGVVYQTGADNFTKRVVGTTATTIAAGDHSHLSAQPNNAFTSGPRFWSGTQAQYDALTKDENTIYDIVA